MLTYVIAKLQGSENAELVYKNSDRGAKLQNKLRKCVFFKKTFVFCGFKLTKSQEKNSKIVLSEATAAQAGSRPMGATSASETILREPMGRGERRRDMVKQYGRRPIRARRGWNNSQR